MRDKVTEPKFPEKNFVWLFFAKLLLVGTALAQISPHFSQKGFVWLIFSKITVLYTVPAQVSPHFSQKQL